MKTPNLNVLESLDPESIACVAGGMINLYEGGRPRPPIEPGHGGIDQPYWDTNGAFRYGAGSWDYGYGHPDGPFEAP